MTQRPVWQTLLGHFFVDTVSIPNLSGWGAGVGDPHKLHGGSVHHEHRGVVGARFVGQNRLWFLTFKSCAAGPRIMSISGCGCPRPHGGWVGGCGWLGGWVGGWPQAPIMPVLQGRGAVWMAGWGGWMGGWLSGCVNGSVGGWGGLGWVACTGWRLPGWLGGWVGRLVGWLGSVAVWVAGWSAGRVAGLCADFF